MKDETNFMLWAVATMLVFIGSLIFMIHTIERNKTEKYVACLTAYKEVVKAGITPTLNCELK
jgi:hypothetical protein